MLAAQALGVATIPQAAPASDSECRAGRRTSIADAVMFIGN
jgi:hypothetical protein